MRWILQLLRLWSDSSGVSTGALLSSRLLVLSWDGSGNQFYRRNDDFVLSVQGSEQAQAFLDVSSFVLFSDLALD